MWLISRQGLQKDFLEILQQLKLQLHSVSDESQWIARKDKLSVVREELVNELMLVPIFFLLTLHKIRGNNLRCWKIIYRHNAQYEKHFFRLCARPNWIVTKCFYKRVATYIRVRASFPIVLHARVGILGQSALTNVPLFDICGIHSARQRWGAQQSTGNCTLRWQ